MRRLVGLVLAALVAVPASGQTPTEAAYARGLDLVTRALEALGGPEVVARGLTLVGEGTRDLTTRLQGAHPERPTLVPVRETLVLALDGLAHETRGRVNPDADEWLRFVHDDAGRMLIVDRLNENAFWVPGRPDQRRRLARTVPHVLLADALGRRATLRHLGAHGGREAVAVALASGEALTLLFEGDRLAGVEYLLDLPVAGDGVVRWTYGPYREVEGLGPYPEGYRLDVGGRLYQEVRYTAVEVGASDLLGETDGIEIPDAPAPPEATGSTASGPPPLARVDTLAAGVYLARRVRGGFHALFVEFNTFAVVVDAPAGFHELQMLPAVDWAGAHVTSSSVGRRLLDTVAATLPGKPVRHLVLTHHHGDHAGGVRPFLAAGATVHAAPETASVVERAARATVTLAPDGYAAASLPPQVHVVEGRHEITDGSRRLVVLDVGPNPHADGMLVAWLPEERLLYQSDLFMPWGGGAPDAARLPVMRWFVEWLDGSGLAPEAVYAMHGVRATAAHLDHVRRLGEG